MNSSFVFLTNRENKTSIRKRKTKIGPQLTNISLLQEQRPYTTSVGRTQNLYAYRSLNNAQEELNQTCGSDASNYVLNNIKNFTKKYNQTIVADDVFSPNSTILSCESARKSQSQPRNIRQMKICGLSLPVQQKVENVVGQPFFINAKQKLARMLARKREKQLQFQTLQVKVHQIQKSRLFLKKQKDKMFQNPEPVTKSEWDSQWRNQNAKEVARYRTRLSIKHKKKSSNFTIEW